MPATYRCAACQATWEEDREPTDCPRCGSRIIDRDGRFGWSMEDHYAAPEASIYVKSPVSSTSFSVTYWLGWAGFVAGFAIAQASTSDTDPVAITAGLLMIGSLCCLLAAYILSWVKIYRGWDAIQPLRQVDWREAEMTTPGRAVGLLFVPFYNLYWNFRALQGLAIKANRYFALSGIRAQPMNEGMAQTSCILVLCSMIPCFGGLPGLANVVIYYLVILDVDRMRGAIRAWQEGEQKIHYVDDFEAP